VNTVNPELSDRAPRAADLPWGRWVLLLAVAVLAARVAAPSDLYDNDQPKTVAYTVDIVEHGRWALPRDMLGRWATKPPMYNWIGVPFVAAGFTAEWALKMPSLLAAGAMLLATWRLGRRLCPVGLDRAALAGLAAVLWLGNLATMKHLYLARPDMVLSAFLVMAWWSGTRLLLEPAPPRRPLLQLALWLCVAGAALTKGPAALLPLLYVTLGAKLLTGQWRACLRTGIAWGLPLALLIIAAWAWSAYQVSPEHFRATFVSDEVVERVAGRERQSRFVIVLELWKMPAYFVSRFLPGSVLAILALLHIGPRHWLRHELAPAILWLLLTVGLFSLSAGKRADYLAPCYPAAAILAAGWLVQCGPRWRLTPGVAVSALLAASGVMLIYLTFLSPAARSGLGDDVTRFAGAIRQAVDGDTRGIVFRETGYNPLQSLLGRNEGQRDPGPPQAGKARWVVEPVRADGPPALLTSPPLPGFVEDRRAIQKRLGLYRVDPP
jgi:4-amino-4-deoxy-L-arabinose transferase-like glycosyltransferase